MSDASLFDTTTFETAAGDQGGAQSPLSPPGTQSLYRKYRPTSFADDDLVGQ